MMTKKIIYRIDSWCQIEILLLSINKFFNSRCFSDFVQNSRFLKLFLSKYLKLQVFIGIFS